MDVSGEHTYKSREHLGLGPRMVDVFISELEMRAVTMPLQAFCHGIMSKEVTHMFLQLNIGMICQFSRKNVFVFVFS